MRQGVMRGESITCAKAYDRRVEPCDKACDRRLEPCEGTKWAHRAPQRGVSVMGAWLLTRLDLYVIVLLFSLHAP